MGLDFKNKIRQFGFIGFMKIVLTSLLRRLTTLTISRHNYMTLDLSNEKIYSNTNDICDIKKLSLEEFEIGDSRYFTEEKLCVYRKWMKDGTHIPYGIVKNNKLIISGWLSLEKIYIGGVERDLQSNEGLILDVYCHPDYRGMGYQGKMNRYMFDMLKEFGKQKAVVLTLRLNVPAYKSMYKSGFRLNKVYLKIGFLNKKWLF